MKPRLIFAIDSFQRGGKERQMLIIASFLLNKGYNLFLVTKKIERGLNYIKEYNISHEIIYTCDGFFQFRRLILILKPDLVASWDLKSSLFSLLIYRFLGFDFLNCSIRHGIRRFKFSHILRSLICRLSPYLVANSQSGLRANNLKAKENRFIIYNGIETKFINTLSAQEIENLRMKLIKTYSEKPGIIYISIANLVPYKDYTTVLKALKEIKEQQFFYYLIIGDGPIRGKIEKKIKKFGLEKKVFITGLIDNVRDYLFISDVMLHSSRGEGISNAILEGMAAGIPIIATDVGGIPETIYPGSSLLFPYKDHNKLIKCLLKVDELKMSFDPNAENYQNHLSKFSVETMVKKYESIINMIIGQHQVSNSN